MPLEIKLKIFEDNKIIDSIEKETPGDLLHLISTLEEFRQSVNEKLTQKIEDDGHIEDYNIDEELISSDEEEKLDSSPKKRKT